MQVQTVYDQWWASDDFPVRNDSRVAYLIDGRLTMLTMARRFLTAQKYIYLASWGLTPGMELVRGADRLGGPEGSTERNMRIEELRTAGLQEADINFWLQNDLSVKNILGYAASKGVDVKVLLWECPELFSHYNPQEAHDELLGQNVCSILDNSAMSLLHHPLESLHQKIAVVDGIHAFVGGLDPLIEAQGEYDRWDTSSHLFSTPLRRTPKGNSPHPWHDVHAVISGPAATDVETNFRQRWNDVIHRRQSNPDWIISERPLPPPIEEGSPVQLARTIPPNTYTFAEQGIHGIAELYSHALQNAQSFIYIENQYLWLRSFIGMDIPSVSRTSPDMKDNLEQIIKALNRGASIAILLPDHPNVGRGFTDDSVTMIYEEASEAVAEGRFQAFCLGTSTNAGEPIHYRPIYVHAKIMIVDDLWSTTGSANLNNRGMRDDAEMNIATINPRMAHDLRMLLWAEHLGLYSDEDMFIVSQLVEGQSQPKDYHDRARSIYAEIMGLLGDPFRGLKLLVERAHENMQAFKDKRPFVGHLLPYLTAEQARAQDLPFRDEHGWLEEVR